MSLGLAQPDRWTCPSCLVTEVPNVRTPAALHRAIVRAQKEHAHEHAVEMQMRKIEAAS